MKILKISIDTNSLQLTDQEIGKKPGELFFTVVDAMVQSYMHVKGGFDESDRRMWYRIEDAFTKANSESKETVELEDAWWGWLKKVQTEARMRPIKLMRLVDELFDKVEGVR